MIIAQHVQIVMAFAQQVHFLMTFAQHVHILMTFTQHVHFLMIIAQHVHILMIIANTFLYTGPPPLSFKITLKSVQCLPWNRGGSCEERIIAVNPFWE